MNLSNSSSEVFLASMLPMVFSIANVETIFVILLILSAIVFNVTKTYFLFKNKGK